MNNIELKEKLIDLVNNHATVYAYGCWGNKLTEALINSKAKQYPWWYTESKKKQLKAMTKLSYVVWGFDCVCMIKAILWGFNADTSKTTGGAVYNSNNVPDISANDMIKRCNNVSTDFSKIEIGEAVWLNGHIGIYVGNSQVVECTPAWKNKVQITNLSQRKWLKHGKLPYITYQSLNTNFLGSRGYLKVGDSGANLEKICDFMSNKVKGNYFGPYLKAVIIEFQKQNKIEADGNIGPITLKKLKEDGFKE